LADLGFEEELENFEGLLEQDEIVDIQNVEKKIKKFNFFCAICYFQTLKISI
jgi:hypothetical protein